ncbi:PREDICTED: AP-3 complex subunit beta-2 [Rhagoletis zephyria]|uniref:AP-3 complex subunit beta-2 n=1 Tax=Rhagoletis zephyria TaxID=28612 RepID=UPI000811610D|nr:PREDICTED: AP-3 complex subunit beta-2 [Rhagoletis zephyria]XP_017466172.1 PREDICTED: AP-3 complex subunit beta-2 [Rhagoletis zephyria]
MISSASPVGLFGSVYNSRNSSSINTMQQQSSASGSSPFAAYSSSSSSPQMGLDVEFGADPASGAFFQSEGRKHDDLKQMLDSNKDGLKLEAMKRIIGMIARGRDASDLFPAVVKNVVSKNIEVKKLVYVYLVRYAEEQQDLALLSISTFQRALKDPNQLIRASALRVLSSIRVSMIVPIVMLAIRDSAMDMSPYVRKTAAHAIPKLYSLDPEQKDELVTVIEKLLSDRTTLVVGSAVMAFDEVCPERVDLIHKNYRKLCNLLVDVDEWGQVIIINMLTRYARTQFVDPNVDEPVDDNGKQNQDGGAAGENFYEESSSGDSSEGSGKEKRQKNKRKNKSDATKERTFSSSSSYHVDLDHRLLLRQTKPLLQSRNASVVMAVAQLYHHVAPRNEVQVIAKALIRLLRSHKEVQSVVLTCIASMSTKRKAIFEPHIKSFFVRTSDPTHIKLLKLDILTNLASGSTIALILREFQTYISSSDRSFVAATIQAIGRCAASIKEVTETCLGGLVHLLSNRDEHVVAESVVVIKNLLQSKSAEHYEIISQMAKLIDYITIPAARASILWLIGEYNEKVPKIAPDVLRKMSKTFVDEEDVVKLQILNLGVKLFLTNPEQTSLLSQYVFTLARYDSNYDVRDRARFLRQFIFPSNGKTTVLSENARKIFLSAKPKPALESKYCERDHFQLGSLSHYLNMRATGYKDLPPFPTEATDTSVRNIEGYMHETTAATASTSGAAASGVATRTPQKQGDKSAHTTNDKNFLSESEKSSAYSESGSSSSSSSSSSSDGESSESEKGQVNDVAAAKPKIQSTGSEPKSDTTTVLVNKTASNGNNNVHLNVNNNGDNDSGTSDSESSSYGSSESSTGSGSESEDGSESSESETESEKQRKFQRVKEKAKETKAKEKEKNAVGDEAAAAAAAPVKSNLDLLLDLDDIPPVGPVMTPSLGGFLTPATPLGGAVGLLPVSAANRIELVGPSHIEFKHRELLNKLSGHGLQVSYRFTRGPHLYSSAMVSIELQFINLSSTEITNIHLSQQTLPAGMNLNEFAPLQCLQPQQMGTSVLGIDFNDSIHAVELEITSSAGKSRVTLKPPVGELVRSVQIGESYFKEERTKLRGMNEHQSRLQLRRDAVDVAALKKRIFECINVAPIATSEGNNELLYFAGQTMNSRSLVLITLDWQTSHGEQLALMVNCEKMVIGSMVLNELRNALSLAFQC